jgi:hypothetical protein
VTHLVCNDCCVGGLPGPGAHRRSVPVVVTHDIVPARSHVRFISTVWAASSSDIKEAGVEVAEGMNGQSDGGPAGGGHGTTAGHQPAVRAHCIASIWRH